MVLNRVFGEFKYSAGIEAIMAVSPGLSLYKKIKHASIVPHPRENCASKFQISLEFVNVLTQPNYLKFYDEESYLLEEVGPRFRESGRIEAVDFYTILAWKANRAKNYHRDRLKALIPSGKFQDAVNVLAFELHSCHERRDRLRLLMTQWGFYLATASAILSILYPDEFTVYDYRLCDEFNDFHYLAQRGFSKALWKAYEMFLIRVISDTPQSLTLRDKDRWLSGKSYRNDAERGCK